MKYVGLIFYKNDESGIAKVNVTDNITGLPYLTDSLIDLYTKDKDATAGAYEEVIFWIDLINDDPYAYTWEVEHSGYHNPAAGGSTFPIIYNGFILSRAYATASSIVPTLTAKHSDYPSVTYPHTCVSGVVSTLLTTITFSGDGVTMLFNPTLAIYASSFEEYSTDGGLTWTHVYSGDNTLTWGANAPLYNNSTITDGKFMILFDYPPSSDVNNVQFKISPLIDTISVNHVLSLAKDTFNIPDVVRENKLIHYNLELIP